MSITATNSGSNYKPVDAGTYPARCYQMILIGTVKGEYMGQPIENTKVRIGWELPTELKEFKEGEGEKPYSISKEFTLSMNEKANLRKVLESWRGKGFTEEEAKSFDITVLLGKPCMLSVIHKTSKQGKLYADISGVTTVPKGMTVPAQINPSFEFSFPPFSKEPFDNDKFSKLPEWMQEQIKSSNEYKSFIEPNHTQTPAAVDSPNTHEDNSDLPF